MNPLNRHHNYSEEHYRFCVSDRQREFLELVLQNKTIDEIAGIMDIHKRNVLALGQRIRKTAERHNFYADSDNELEKKTQSIPVKGVSTRYAINEETGELEAVGGWVKTDKKFEQMLNEAREIVDAMIETIPPVPCIELEESIVSKSIKSLLNLHVLTDYHLGMLAWKDETLDENWDTEIGRDFLIKFMQVAIANAPAARTGVLLQLGDFLHFDGVSPVTPGSGHVLDADSRFAKVVRSAITALRIIIGMMLKKYPEVRIVMAEGNHDLSSSIWLREMLAALYENEPRIKVDTSPSPFGAMQHGKTMLGWHHGHKKNLANIDRVMASNFSTIFGETEFRYCHMGHFHHREVKETNLMIPEMHSTIGPKDAYSATGGYASQRAAEIITYHDEYGEVGRGRLTPELIRAYSK